METNSLYFGDNLKVLSERSNDGTFKFPSESVDLVYLDPPFNSNRDYSLIFKETSGDKAEAQIKAFEDTWHWGPTARDALLDTTVTGVNEGRIPDNVGRTLDAIVRGIGHNDMSAYLVMMTPRLVQLHRVLKPTGSLWLHCDPTASHYLKIVLDSILGPTNFRNEVTWKRTHAHGDSRRAFANISDRLLLYTGSDQYTFNRQFLPYTQEYIDKYYRWFDDDDRRYQLVTLRSPNPRPNLTYEYKGVQPHPNGWAVSREQMEQLDAEGRLRFPQKPGETIREKYFLDEMPGRVMGDTWDDIPPINSQAKERLGYPTQKPMALLERVLLAGSNQGDIVLDPFCGCGTALVAAQKLERKWVGIDITHLSIAVMRARLMDSFGLADVPVHGLPADLESARMLAEESKDGRYEFQWWSLGLIDAKPVGGVKKKGADRGIDGVITFSERDSIQRILVSVKSDKNAKLAHAKELLATLETEDGAIGILIELNDATPEMKRVAVEAGQYESELWGGKYDRLQILTIEQLLAGANPDIPKFLPGYQKAEKVKPNADQTKMFGAS